MRAIKFLCSWLVGIKDLGHVGVYLINGLANGILDALAYPIAWAIPESGTPATISGCTFPASSSRLANILPHR